MARKTTRKQWEDQVYRYTAEVIEAHDGDTLRVNFDYGFGIIDQNKLLRLAGIQAPELKDPGGKEARDYLAKLCKPGSIVLVQTIYDKMEKYGRFFGYVWHMPGYGQLGENSSVNRLMIQAGHAVAWDGKGRRP